MAKAKKDKEKDNGDVTFEKRLEELESIVRRLESEELGVEGAMAEYQKGLEALKRCRSIIDEAERKLEILVKADGDKIETRRLELEDNRAASPPAASKKKKTSNETGEERDTSDRNESPKGGFLF